MTNERKEKQMKIPKYIEQALERREKYAEKLNEACAVVDKFIFKNGLDDEIEDYDFCTGVEIYGNPSASAERIRQAIINHKK